MDATEDACFYLARCQYGLISHRQARELGASPAWIRHRVDRGLWLVLAKGVYRMRGAPHDSRVELLAPVLQSSSESWISLHRAAALHGVAGFDRGPIVLTVRFGTQVRCVHTRVRRSNLVLPEHVGVVDGIPVTSLERTLFDLSSEIHPLRLARAYDSALVRGLDGGRMWRVLLDLAGRGRAGTVVTRDLLLARAGERLRLESELEARFIGLVRRHGLPMPQTQVDLGDDEGWIGRVDFHWPWAAHIVEVDGALWHTSPMDRQRDQERVRRLNATGRTVARYTWADITHRELAVATELRNRLGSPPELNS